ncbi:hypothetical protein CVT24_009634 [Panaeolus cyanescens]|uniref:Uncharacterized protein n=1 Tax=Panaeolus cyanescens TaxID=181874 RepID=A0A409YA13_9AGAR|nr:hypothetical protein CVT24_009634 [Panaeolus cyanescens]
MIIDPPKAQDGELELTPESHPGQTPLHPSYPPSPNHLQLDPGPKKRPARRITPRGVCFALALLIAFGVVMMTLSIIRGLLRSLSKPHIKLYQDPKSGIVSGPTVVKPLVGKQGELGGLFDLRATVWIKENLEHEHTKREDDDTEPKREGKETVLVEETIFTGVSLHDKSVKTAINLRIPTEIFKNAVLHESDLRASFILIPKQPSLLDRAVNFSTVNPKTLVQPVRSYPLNHEPTLKDDIIDSFGISTKLLEFYPIQSRCRNSKPLEDSDTSFDFPMDDLDVEIPEPTNNPSSNTKSKEYKGSKSNTKATIGLPVLESHPYIITRTFLRVVDMTQLYKNQAYDANHKKLKATRLSCLTYKQTGAQCERNFQTHGNFETKIRLQSSNGKKSSHEWAYGPFLTTGNNVWGPMDLVPVPVNREDCLPSEEGTSTLIAEDEPYVNVQWHITYSGRIPGKLMFSDAISQAKKLNMSATEEEKKVEQWDYVLYQGMLGHPYREDFHPRRMFMLGIFGLVFVVLDQCLTAYYFFSLASTVGLSTIGTTLIASTWLLDYILSAISKAHSKNSDLFDFFWDVIFRFLPQIIPVLMLKAALRAEVEWTRGGIMKAVPRIRFNPPTHRERASQRIESRVPFTWMVGLFCFLGTFQHFFPLENYYIISPRNTIKPPEPTGLDVYISYIQAFLVSPSYTLGRVLQMTHNHYSRTFAGKYKLAVWLSALGSICYVASESVTVVGYRDVHEGFPLGMLFTLIMVAADALQAWVYPSVVHTEEDVDVQ